MPRNILNKNLCNDVKTFVILNKEAVGLGNVDNTSDVNKPVSSATQNSLDGKENSISSGSTSDYFRGDKTFQTLDKTAVGLGSVDNTSDINKPVSSATQTALGSKENSISSGSTSDYYRGDKTFQTLDKTVVGLGSADNTSDVDKPVSSATQTALDSKCPLNSSNIIPNQYLPSSVNDIIEVSNFSSLPVTGESNKIYVTIDDHKAFRWSGTSYVEISASLVIGTTTGTCFDGGSGSALQTTVAGKQDTLTFGKTNGNALKLQETVIQDDFLLMGANNVIGKTKSETKSLLDIDNVDNIAVTSLAGTNMDYNSSTNKLDLKSTVSGLTKVAVGSTSANDATVGLETFGKRIASRIDGSSAKDVLYLNNAGGSNAETGIIFRVNAGTDANFVTRYDGTSYKIGKSSSIFDGGLTEYMRVNATEMKISGDCNLTSGNIYKIDDDQIDSEDILYVSTGTDTLRTKIDENQDAITSSNRLNANLIGNGDVSNTEFELLNSLTTAILQTSDLGLANKVAPLDANSKLDIQYYTNTEYQLGNNLSFDTSTSPHTINMASDLTSVNSIKSVSTSDLTLGAGNNTQTGDKIIFQTNDVERAYINNLDLDLSVNVNIPNDKHYQIDGDDVLYNASTSIHKNIHLNARILQNISSTTSDGMFINYLSNTGISHTNAHLRFYSGGAASPRLFIESDGDIGINTVNPTEKLEVNGNINITTGNEYKIDGTAIVHSYIGGSNINIDSNKNINLDSEITVTKINCDSYVGIVNPYVTKTATNSDHILVMYNTSLIPTPLPPANLPLIVCDISSNNITLNSSTGLLKTNDIQVSGDITAATNITSTTSVNTANVYATTLNGSNGNFTNSLKINAQSSSAITKLLVNSAANDLPVDGLVRIGDTDYTNATNKTLLSLAPGILMASGWCRL